MDRKKERQQEGTTYRKAERERDSDSDRDSDNDRDRDRDSSVLVSLLALVNLVLP